MTRIDSPKNPPELGDRQLECELALEDAMRQLVDDAVVAGWAPREVFAALRSLVGNQRDAYGEDPDPADDPNWVTASTPSA
ncbi:MAG TPA: hypothetical protein VGN93_01620 [Shinella sp.]|jgi:hypothetical protein|uniref:hypothetical protein n=1 Tax=Shinella sp. TaxID=1870904 RepID=UPI002E1400E0|nr:hypothetical protein [Shinella sp.]